MHVKKIKSGKLFPFPILTHQNIFSRLRRHPLHVQSWVPNFKVTSGRNLPKTSQTQHARI